MMGDIPIIDFSGLTTESGKRDIAKRLYEVYSTIGFGIIINHGIPEHYTKELLEVSRLFQDLPLDYKETFTIPHSACGYISGKSFKLKKTSIGESTNSTNLNESFAICTECSDTTQGITVEKNNWPERIPEMRPVAERYRDALKLLSIDLLQTFSLGLGLTESDLDYLINPSPVVNLRLLHYFKQNHAADSNQFGIAPHSDYGIFTLVSQDSVGGLQVRAPNSNDWIDVEYIPNSFILNTGDSLARVSNGKLLSTPHRVLNNSNKDRYSAVFFFQTDLGASLKPLATFCSDSEPACFPDISYGDYIKELMRQNYGRK